MTIRLKGLADYLRSYPHPGGIVVCEQPRFIYIKTAKAAGTSILRRHLQLVLPHIFFRKDHPVRFQEWRARITDRQLEDYFIFTVVRNPWDRLVSLAAYFGLEFSHFLHHLDDYLREETIRVHALPSHVSSHWKGIPFVDQICRLESLQPDYDRVCDRLGLARHTLEHANRSARGHYAAYYTDVERALVERIYADDLRFFGYRFEQEQAPCGLARLIKGIATAAARRLRAPFPLSPRCRRSGW